MKAVYEDFYKIHGCAAGRCECEKSNKNCDVLAENLCLNVNECNDCMLENPGLASAYVPYQCDFDVMTKESSLVHGTVFAKLVKPYKKETCPEQTRRVKNGC